MKVEGTFTFAGPRSVVYELLQDPAVLAKAMPGTKRLERVTPERFEGQMKVGIGPVTAAEFSLAVTLREQVAPERYAMDIDSRGQLGFVRGTAHVQLDESGPNETTMRYSSDLQVGGKIAAVGQRVIDAAARMMTQKGLDALQRELKARLSGGSTA